MTGNSECPRVVATTNFMQAFRGSLIFTSMFSTSTVSG